MDPSGDPQERHGPVRGKARGSGGKTGALIKIGSDEDEEEGRGRQLSFARARENVDSGPEMLDLGRRSGWLTLTSTRNRGRVRWNAHSP